MANCKGKKAYLLFAQEKYLESAASFINQSHYLSLFNCKQDYSRQIIDLQRCQNNVALCYLKVGNLDSATWYQNLALHTIISNENKYPENNIAFDYSKAVIYGDEAEVLALQGKYMQAEALYKKSITGTTALEISYTQSSQARLADAYLNDNKRDSAFITFTALKTSLDKVSNEKQLISWYRLNVKYYAQINQPAKALQFQEKYEIIRDSVEERDQKFIAVDISKEFENLQLKYSNEVLQKESKLNSFYLVIVILIVFITAVIAALIWYNLTRERKLHLQLQQKNEDMQKAFSSLEQSHQENNRIIRIVAHDLKNPISAINNLIYSLLRKDYSGDLKEIFQLIKTACGNSMTLINAVLNQQKDPAIIRKELVDMKSLLEYCVNLLQNKADEKNQQLTLYADHAVFMINRQKMWRVVSNIVGNAIKFSPEHSVIDIKLQRSETSILLSVHDKGVGIPASLKDKIFSMAADAGNQENRSEEPDGIGLSISKSIIEEHEGKIWFDSTDGKGSVFYVALPYLN